MLGVWGVLPAQRQVCEHVEAVTLLCQEQHYGQPPPALGGQWEPIVDDVMHDASLQCCLCWLPTRAGSNDESASCWWTRGRACVAFGHASAHECIIANWQFYRRLSVGD
jgi:hypothetical protein